VAEVIAQSNWVNKSVIVFKVGIVVVISRQIASGEDRIGCSQHIVSRVTSIRVIGGLILFDDLLGTIPDTRTIANTLSKVS